MYSFKYRKGFREKTTESNSVDPIATPIYIPKVIDIRLVWNIADESQACLRESAGYFKERFDSLRYTFPGVDCAQLKYVRSGAQRAGRVQVAVADRYRQVCPSDSNPVQRIPI